MSNLPEPTQATSKSRVSYSSVILFMYNVEVEYPFSCQNLNNLVDTDFPFYLVEGCLDDESRMIPFQLYSDQKFCVFAKIQFGEWNIQICIKKSIYIRNFHYLYRNKIVIFTRRFLLIFILVVSQKWAIVFFIYRSWTSPPQWRSWTA